MSKHSITYYLSLFAIMATSCSSYAMEQQKRLNLSTIEKRLLIREINKQGKDPLLEEINKKREIKFIYSEEQKKNGIKRPMCLAINDTFYKSNTEADPLTKNIFDTIEARERQYKSYSELAYQTPPSNNLGNRTKYYWIDENNAAVKIAARFKYIGHDQRGLTAFVANYPQ